MVVVACVGLAGCQGPGKVRGGSAGERAAIRRACLDYAAGFYEGDPARLRRGLHPELIKRTVEEGRLKGMSRAELVGVATDKRRSKPRIRVRILDVHDGIATAKIVSRYVDYAHLAKTADGWRIVNVLWGAR